MPYEATSLMGAAEVLLSTLRNEDLGGGSNGATPRSSLRRPGRPRIHRHLRAEASRPVLPESSYGLEISPWSASVDAVRFD